MGARDEKVPEFLDPATYLKVDRPREIRLALIGIVSMLGIDIHCAFFESAQLGATGKVFIIVLSLAVYAGAFGLLFTPESLKASRRLP